MTSAWVTAVRVTCGVAALLALSACGSDDDRLSGITYAQDLVSGATASVRAPQQTGALHLTRADLAQILTPVDLVTVESTGAQAVIAKIASNAGVETWSSVDKKTLSLRSGVLVASRGLGDDLIGATVPTLSQITGGGSYTRRHSWIEEDDLANRHDFSCQGQVVGPTTITVVERSYPVREIRETCNGVEWSFRNVYWVQTSGKLRQSRQYVSDDIGYVMIQHLSD
jgi:hypothetical protein